MKMNRMALLFQAWAAIALSAPPAANDSAKLPEEANRLKQNFRQAAERAVQPLRERYIADLKRLLDQTTRAGKLEDALAIKNEIEAVSAGTGAAADTVAEFERQLMGVKWTWNGAFTFEFQPDGKSSGRGLTWKTVRPYTIEYKFPDSNHGTIVFERNISRAAIDEITSSGKKNPMTLFRVKD